jgi:flagellar biosynthesis protein
LSTPPRHQNPTRPAPRSAARRPVAVALKYEFGAQSLPRIVATGKGTVAEQILELAFANGVKVREDADLVEILSAIEVDSDIPVEAIAAVAEILAYVYRANGAIPVDPGAGADAGPDDAPSINSNGPW